MAAIVEEGCWLHLSDLHFADGDPYDRNVVLRALLSSLPKFVERGLQPHAVFVTGDIANSGQATEYEAATGFFDALLQTLALPKSHLFIIPGNHDVDRRRAVGLARTVLSREESDSYFGLPELPHLPAKFRAYREWFDSYFAGIRHFPLSSSCGQPEAVQLGGLRIALLPINTALFSSDDSDHARLLIGRRCIDSGTQALSQLDASLRLALMHHPAHWLSPVEAENITASLRSHFDCILTGHLHVSDVVDIQGECVVFSAGALYQTRKWPNRAMFVKVSDASFRIHPLRFEDSPQEHWTTDTSLFPNNPDFERTVPRHVSFSAATAAEGAPLTHDHHTLPVTTDEEVLRARKEFESDLFVTPSDRLLYVEPRLFDRPQELDTEGDGTPTERSIDSIVLGSDSIVIESKPEYGGTTLCKRLLYKFVCETTHNVVLADASELPNYRAKLRSTFAGVASDNSRSNIIILDNFDGNRDEKLLKELRSLSLFSRYIILVSSRDLRRGAILPEDDAPTEFTYLYLWGMARSDVRQMATDLFDTADQHFISSVVEKVYSDLLALCIPLTPSNVIMYLRVIHKEGDFHPLNRVDIVSRYLSDVLRGTSDLYVDSFNHRNKLDVLSGFSYSLYSTERSGFTRIDWRIYCSDHMSSSLLRFDADKLFDELVSSKIFTFDGERIGFRYSFFFVFFLGRYISKNRDVLMQFLDEPFHYDIKGLVEVITGVGSDNDVVAGRLCDKLEVYLAQFFDEYVNESFEPFKGAIWADNTDGDKAVWDSVTKQIEAGPKSAAELDLIKSAPQSELRTGQQEVRFVKLKELESALFIVQHLLLEALRSGEDISGVLKKRAVVAVLRAYFVSLQLGVLLSPQIAIRRYVRWGGLHFINHDPEIKHNEEGRKKAAMRVAAQLNFIIARTSSEQLATRKLGEVFRSLAEEGLPGDYVGLLNFACIIASKPHNWEDVVQQILISADRRDYQLYSALRLLMKNYREDINRTSERDALKRLVALIQTKRQLGKNAPGMRPVTTMLRRMEEQDFFEKEAESGD